MIAVLIWYESKGNPLAYSKDGAVGLMQVMPKDGLAADDMCINGLCFADRPTIKELEDPEFNIFYGTQLLANWIQENGSLREGLRRYGPKDVGYTYADMILSAHKEVAQ